MATKSVDLSKVKFDEKQFEKISQATARKIANGGTNPTKKTKSRKSK